MDIKAAIDENAKYWTDRLSEVEAASHKTGMAAYEEIEEQYQQAQKDIEAQIDKWYGRLAANNGVSLTEARKMLTSSELKEFKWDVNEYIKHGKENALNQQWMKELENASARYHISRLEAMKLECQQQIEKAFGNQLDTVDSAMRKIYEDSYYHTAYEVQKGVGIGWDFAKLDTDTIDKVIHKPWAPNGSDFKSTIWHNKDALVQQCNTTLTQSIMMGKDPWKATKAIAERLHVSKSNAGRLVMTESAAFSSMGQKDSFKELGVEQYEIVATLDSRTSEICREMDGKHFKMSEYQVGETAPPFHPWCRSTTVPYFEDDFGSVGQRAARDENGKTYYVPADMKYKDWEQSFVSGGSKANLQQTGQSAELTPGGVHVGKSMDRYNDEQRKAASDLLDNAPQEIKDLYNKYGDKLLPVLDPDPNVTSSTAYYDPTDKHVHMICDDVAKGSDYEEPYSVHFHEFGHNLDHLATSDGSAFSKSYRNADGKSITDVIEEDFDNDIFEYYKDHKYMDDYDFVTTGEAGMDPYIYTRSTLNSWRKINGLSRDDPAFAALRNELDEYETDPDKIRDFYKKHFDVFSKVNYSELKVVPDFLKYMKANYSLSERGDFSDMIEPWTVKNLDKEFPLGVGHGKAYALSGKGSTETFAEMSSASVAAHGSLKVIKKYLPNAYKMFLEMVKEMAK